MNLKYFILLSLFTMALLVSSCNNAPVFPKDDLAFLYGDWIQENAMDGVQIKLHCEETDHGITCTRTTSSEKFIQSNYQLEYKIFSRNGNWLWYFDHSSRTVDKPVHTYKLHKLKPADYVKAPEPGVVTFQGDALESPSSYMQLVNYNGEKILIMHSMLANSSVYVRAE